MIAELLCGRPIDAQADYSSGNRLLAEFLPKVCSNCCNNVIQIRRLVAGELVKELLNQANKFGRAEELNIGNSLFQVLSNFSQIRVL